MILKNGDIVFNDFAKGVSPSYLGDFKNIQGLDIFSVPGVAFANQKLSIVGVDTASYTGRTFTANAGNDEITVALDVFSTGQAVRLTSTGTLPAGLNTTNTYYVIRISGSVYKLASTVANALAGTPVDITDAGTGTHTMTGTSMGRIKNMVQNTGATTSNYRMFAIDEDGKVWVQFQSIWTHLPGNAGGGGQGLAIWKNYLFAVGNSGVISVYGSLTNVGGSASWTATWQTATGNDAFIAPIVVGSDDILYIGQGRYVSSVEEATPPFAPGTGGSYTWTDIALDLPSGYRIRCMCENGPDLVIGTWVGTSFPNLFMGSLEVKKADLFFWDRSDSTFNQPVHIEENGVNQVISINNLVYAVCGHEGRVYLTNGTTAEFFTQIPMSMMDRQQNITQHLFFWPFAIAQHRGRLIVGVSSGDVSSNATLSPLGVYAINLQTGAIALEYIAASGNTGSSGSIGIGALVSTSEQELYVGFYYEGSISNFPGCIQRVTSNETRYGTGAFFESGLAIVGGANSKPSYSTIEYILGKPLNVGEQIRVSARRASSGAYTVISTLTSSTENQGSLTNIQIGTKGSLLENATAIQFKVEFICTDLFTSPELVALNIKQRADS